MTAAKRPFAASRYRHLVVSAECFGTSRHRGSHFTHREFTTSISEGKRTPLARRHIMSSRGRADCGIRPVDRQFHLSLRHPTVLLRQFPSPRCIPLCCTYNLTLDACCVCKLSSQAAVSYLPRREMGTGRDAVSSRGAKVDDRPKVDIGMRAKRRQKADTRLTLECFALKGRESIDGEL
jgi:hypothetical protein